MMEPEAKSSSRWTESWSFSIGIEADWETIDEMRGAIEEILKRLEIEKVDGAIAKTERLKKGLMNDLLNGKRRFRVN